MADPKSHDVYSLLLNGKGVCGTHAQAFSLLLALCNIDCVTVDGTTGENLNSKTYLNGHEWDEVKIDGQYYGVDVTWDDNGEDETSTICYRYFKIPDTLMKKDHKWNSSAYPECTSDKNEYFSDMEFVSRDGDTVYYSSISDGFKLYSINIDGTDKKKLNNYMSINVIASG